MSKKTLGGWKGKPQGMTIFTGKLWDQPGAEPPTRPFKTKKFCRISPGNSKDVNSKRTYQATPLWV